LHDHAHGVPFATLVLRGSYTEVRDGVPEALAAGALVLHDGSERHADHFICDAHCLNIELPAGEAPGRTGSLKLDAPLRGGIERLVQTFYSAPPARSERLRDALAGVRALLRRAPEPSPAPPDWMQTVLDEFSWLDDGPLRGAARLAGVHPVHFSRAFQRHAGMTPNAYRLHARLRSASVLLLGSGGSLARVAQQCGFSDQSHLTRTFRAALGLTPAAYRKIFAR
jgi:AraC family transcriptional regulator